MTKSKATKRPNRAGLSQPFKVTASSGLAVAAGAIAATTASLPAPPPVMENATNDAPRYITDGSGEGEVMDVGQCYPQGDLYFMRIASLPKSAKPRSNRQLADGDTQGSRHVCAVGQVFDADKAELSRMILSATGGDVDIQPTYIGPVVVTDEHDRAVIEHPEHGDHHYSGKIVLATVVQRALDAEEREAAVRD